MDLFEPGSTNKLITLSTAIEDGLVTPDTEIDVPSVLRVGPTPFTDVDAHGDVHMTVTDILRQSSNIGTIKVAERLGKTQLARALRSFGLGVPTTVQFPGQASGLLLDPSHYYEHRVRVDGDRLRRRGDGDADARRVRDDRQRRGDAPAAPARRHHRREGRAPPGQGFAGPPRRVGEHGRGDVADARRAW